MVVLAANKEVRGLHLACIRRNGDAFKNSMRIEINKQAILKCARLGFVAVDGQVARSAIRWREETPLQTSRKSCAAATAKDGGFHLIGDLARLHGKDFFKGLVAARSHVLVKPDGLALRAILGNALGENGRRLEIGGRRHGGLVRVSYRVSRARSLRQ